MPFPMMVRIESRGTESGESPSTFNEIACPAPISITTFSGTFRLSPEVTTMSVKGKFRLNVSGTMVLDSGAEKVFGSWNSTTLRSLSMWTTKFLNSP